MRGALAVDVIVEADVWTAVPGAEAVVRDAIAAAARSIAAPTQGCELAVLLTDDAAIRRLNAQWRGIDKPTNVLSFPNTVSIAGPASRHIGDIAIAHETLAREAQAEGKRLSDHLMHLSVHGFLHLMGYDHESDAQADTMESLERVILERLGVSNPYPAHYIEA